MRCIVVGSEICYLLVGEFDILVFGFGDYATFWVLQEHIRIYPTTKERMQMFNERLNEILKEMENETE